MIGYAFHPEAEADINDNWEYIAADNPVAVDRVSNEFEQTLDNLVQLPSLGRRRPDLTSRPLRFIVIREYLIAYAPDEEPTWVIANIHGRRSPRVIADILRRRE